MSRSFFVVLVLALVISAGGWVYGAHTVGLISVWDYLPESRPTAAMRKVRACEVRMAEFARATSGCEEMMELKDVYGRILKYQDTLHLSRRVPGSMPYTQSKYWERLFEDQTFFQKYFDAKTAEDICDDGQLSKKSLEAVRARVGKSAERGRECIAAMERAVEEAKSLQADSDIQGDKEALAKATELLRLGNPNVPIAT